MNSEQGHPPTQMASVRRQICGVPIDTGVTLESAVQVIGAALHAGTRLMVSFVNPHATHLASDPDYVRNLARMDLILCDGIGMSVAASMLSGNRTDRISFDNTSLAPHVMRACATGQRPVFLVGGQSGVAERAAGVLRQGHPGLAIPATYSGYGNDLDSALSAIVRHPGSVVIVGLGAGRQERFLVDLADSGWWGIAFTCGGFLDQTQVSPSYYPAVVDRLNLRFAYRLMREPGRLWRRYLVEYRPFLRTFARELLMKQSSHGRRTE